MAFDSQTRNALAKLTADARTLLVAEFTRQLQSIYGIQPTGQISELESLDHLDDEQRAVAGVLRDRICHLAAGNLQDKKGLAEAVSRLIREQSFTVLNRFAALRMCEERGLVQQCVGADVRSKGFQVYLQTAGAGLGEQYDRYRTYLFCLFDEISLDLGVLFNRYSTYGLLFPRETALFELLGVLNRKELAHVWVEDEAIGWIYQYYNDPAERKKMREESSAPRNSRELAVRNQFFTPRYVVEFLSDNTLGRIWYEMTKGMTRLKDQCRYLVRRPTEIFLAPGETPPAENQEPGTKNQERTQEDLLRAPVHIPHRPLKDPREIRMLDPACGSMHFGLYCFDLFETIYAEAWDIAKSGSLLAGADPSFSDFCLLTSDFSSKEDFLRQVPRLIIEHNIHGIDIDPRCTQIAGLSLWLRAQKTWKMQGVKPADRPRIRRSNIVCAEPMPGDKALLRDFVEREFPAKERAVCLRLLETIIDKMQLAGEAGSLLKIEEEIRSAIEDARRTWDKIEEYLPGLSTGNPPSDLRPLSSDLRPPTSASAPRHLATDFWQRIEERLYAALSDYAEQAEHGGGFQRRLFAEDAARGFAFIDVCRKRYDVVLMNPPFGKPATKSLKYLKEAFPDDWKDIYAAFFTRNQGALAANGVLGAITSLLFFYSKQLRDLRQTLIQKKRLRYAVELGSRVLDAATVDTALSIITASESATTGFLDLTSTPNKGEALLERSNSARFDFRRLDDFKKIFGWPLCYHVHESKLRLWGDSERLEPSLADIVAGNHTFDDFRFLRLLLEVPSSELRTTWVPYEKGGEFQPFFSPTELAFNWADEGAEARSYQAGEYGTDAQTIQSISKWFRAGLTYPRVSSVGFSPRVLPAGCIFSEKGMSIFLHTPDDKLPLLGLLASSWMEDLLCAFGRHRAYENSAVANLPFGESLLNRFRDELTELAIQAIAALQRVEAGAEGSPFFLCPSEVIPTTKVAESPENCIERVCSHIDLITSKALFAEERDAVSLVSEDRASLFRKHIFHPPKLDQRLIDKISWCFGSAFGRWDIRYATGEQAASELPDPFAPLPVCPPGQLQNAQGLPARPEDVPAAYPVRIPWAGILVDDPNHPMDLERHVREVIEIIWKDRAEAIEAEACEILGVKSLRDYFRKPAGFFADHLKRYSKSRRQAPIYWPLSTASGSYTLWLYYHRLTGQTLFQGVTDFLEPKIRDVSRDIERLQKGLIDGGTAGQRDELDALMDFRLELESLKTELLRVAHLPYQPNLNDGVIINAAPLWKLFRLKKWQKDCRECWDQLESGAYDWAHLAFHIWPDRVREKCRTDKSFAIAHNLEALCERPPAKPKKRAAKKQPEEEFDL
jgi:hypothetical protein